MPDGIQLDTRAGLYMFKDFVWPNQSKYKWKEFHPEKCMYTYIHIYMCIYVCMKA